MIALLKMHMRGGGGGRFNVLKRQKMHSLIKMVKLRVSAKNPYNMGTSASNMYLLQSRIFTFLTYSQSLSCMDLAGVGDQGSGPPWKISKLSVSLRIPVLTPCKTLKLPRQHSMLDHHRTTSETPYKWRFTGRPMMACT